MKPNHVVEMSLDVVMYPCASVLRIGRNALPEHTVKNMIYSLITNIFLLCSFNSISDLSTLNKMPSP